MDNQSLMKPSFAGLLLTLRTLFSIFTIFCCPSVSVGQLHPPEVRQIFPIGGSIGSKTRVVIGGVSFRGTKKLIFDRPNISAEILPPNALSAPTPNDDGVPIFSADILIGKNASPGIVSFRVVSDAGVSNAVKWCVGRELATMDEKEPNNTLPQAQPVQLPVSINGKIDQPGDVDIYTFELIAGKTFVAEVCAAAVDSPLDSLLTLMNSSGKQVANNDDFNGSDSLLTYAPKSGGKYYLAVRSSVGAGSGNDSYRLSIGAIPLLTGAFPGTAVKGVAEQLTPFGFNLPKILEITVPADYASRLTSVHSQGTLSSNSIVLGVSDIPSVTEIEPNDDFKHATRLKLPAVASGTFYRADGKPGGDLDYYVFHVDVEDKKENRYVFDVQSQDRSGVRSDPILTLYDAKGSVLAENDDTSGKDSHVEMTFTVAGDYYLKVKNQTDMTGKDLVYQLLAQFPPPPGFSLSTETRNRAIPRGGISVFEVTAVRDRWDGPINIEMNDLPQGVRASKLTLESGVSKGLLILETDNNAQMSDFPIHIQGVGMVDGKKSVKELIRADDSIWKGTQKTTIPILYFLHAAVTAANEVTPKTEVKEVVLKVGQSSKLKVSISSATDYSKQISLTIVGLPEGVTVTEVRLEPGKKEAELELKAGPKVRLGETKIVVNALVQHNPLVLLDRFSLPLTLRIEK